MSDYSLCLTGLNVCIKIRLTEVQTSMTVALMAASFSAANPAASFRYLLPTLLSNHFRSTKTSLKCSLSNWKRKGSVKEDAE